MEAFAFVILLHLVPLGIRHIEYLLLFSHGNLILAKVINRVIFPLKERLNVCRPR
jgi:hypothetical protein